MDSNEIVQDAKKEGHLDMPRLFQAEANSLLDAVVRGRLMHATKNIRDSGAPLEARLRDVLGSRLPFGYQMKCGYLYDIRSNCTPQIDAMVLCGADNHTMMRTSEGAVYAPFSSLVAMFEVKTKLKDLRGSLAQVQNIASAVDGMASDLRSRRDTGGAMIHHPVSVLFCATSGGASFKKVREEIEKSAKEQKALPTYIFILDRACLFASEHISSFLLGLDSIDFNSHRNPGSYRLWVPSIQDELKQGRALLWLYFAILNAVSQHGGNSRLASDYLQDAVRTHALELPRILDEQEEWPAEASNGSS